MKKIFNERNQIHNFMSSSGSGSVINYSSGSGSGSGSTTLDNFHKVFFAKMVYSDV